MNRAKIWRTYAVNARLFPALVTAVAVMSTPVLCRGSLDTSQTFVVVIVETPLLLLPDASREPLRMLEAGTVLRFLDEDADWFHAEFQDFHYGRRVGYVQKKDAVAVEVEERTTAAADRGATTR